MKRHYWNNVILFTLLIVVIMSTSCARADFEYAFSGKDAFDGGSPENFVLMEPSLFTTTGAFTTSFTIGADTFTSGFFDASNDCFSFSTTTATDCSALSPDSFYAQFPGAITVGTFSVGGTGGTSACDSITGHPCDALSSVAISATSPTPEPSSVLLLGSGMLGVAGVLRKRWKG